MSIRESYNELTWKVYRKIHKPSFWIVSVIIVAIICCVTVLIIKADDIAYNRLMQAPDISKCEEYLGKYSESEHANEIGQLLNELKKQKEKDTYESICKYATIENCESFLSRYPNSEYYKEVEGKLIVLEYDKACQSNDLQALRAFVEKYPQSFRVKEINKKIKAYEDDFYEKNVHLPISKVNRNKVNEYLSLFPNGRYITQAKAKLNELDDEDAYNRAVYSNTMSAFRNYLSNYPHGKHAVAARTKVNEFEEIERCQNYSLPNGSEPYAKYYGSNYSYSYGRAAVEVSASAYSDVLVIVRYNNSNGRVAGHKYIRKGCSSTIYLPSEKRYQVFFYYGRGWYAKKEMPGGVKGGFLNDESYSKDGSSEYLGYGQTLTYTLTQVTHGNFSTSGSNKNEFF